MRKFNILNFIMGMISLGIYLDATERHFEDQATLALAFLFVFVILFLTGVIWRCK